MKHIDFYFDVISPYSYLAFERLPLALEGISHSVSYRPVLFAGLLKHHGQLGPAEIAPKKAWTFQQVSWLARELGVELTAPLAHPFNPLVLLRLMLAMAPGDGTCNRWIAQTVFQHVWAQNTRLDADCPKRLNELTSKMLKHRELGCAEDDVSAVLSNENAKVQLKANTDGAIARHLFGVPSMVVGDQVFWGVDALPMLRAYLLGDEWFDSPGWLGSIPSAGIQRAR